MENIELQGPSDSSKFHQLIVEGKVKEIQRFIDLNPDEKFVIFNNSSAIAMSLKCGFLNIYEVLVVSGFKLAPSEDFANIFRSIEENSEVKSVMKVKLKKIHQKYMVESNKKYLFKIILMSKLTSSTPEDKQQEFEDIIVSTFEEIAKIAEVEKVMKYVASASGRLWKFPVVLSFSNFTIRRPSNLFRLWLHDNRRDEPRILRSQNKRLDLFWRQLHLHRC
jgi:hypothetical protein